MKKITTQFTCLAIATIIMVSCNSDSSTDKSDYYTNAVSEFKKVGDIASLIDKSLIDDEDVVKWTTDFQEHLALTHINWVEGSSEFKNMADHINLQINTEDLSISGMGGQLGSLFSGMVSTIGEAGKTLYYSSKAQDDIRMIKSFKNGFSDKKYKLIGANTVKITNTLHKGYVICTNAISIDLPDVSSDFALTLKSDEVLNKYFEDVSDLYGLALNSYYLMNYQSGFNDVDLTKFRQDCISLSNDTTTANKYLLKTKSSNPLSKLYYDLYNLNNKLEYSDEPFASKYEDWNDLKKEGLTDVLDYYKECIEVLTLTSIDDVSFMDIMNESHIKDEFVDYIGMVRQFEKDSK